MQDAKNKDSSVCTRRRRYNYIYYNTVRQDDKTYFRIDKTDNVLWTIAMMFNGAWRAMSY